MRSEIVRGTEPVTRTGSSEVVPSRVDNSSVTSARSLGPGMGGSGPAVSTWSAKYRLIPVRPASPDWPRLTATTPPDAVTRTASRRAARQFSTRWRTHASTVSDEDPSRKGSAVASPRTTGSSG